MCGDKHSNKSTVPDAGHLLSVNLRYVARTLTQVHRYYCVPPGGAAAVHTNLGYVCINRMLSRVLMSRCDVMISHETIFISDL